MVILLSVVPLAVPANVIFVIEIVQGRHGVVFIRATVVTNQLYLQKRAFTASHVFMRACSGNLSYSIHQPRYAGHPVRSIQD